MIPAILARDTCSPLHVLRCDPDRCDRRRAPPPPPTSDTAASRVGYCQQEGCWLASAFTREGVKALADRLGIVIVKETA